MKLKFLLAAFLLCAASALAQGKIQFTWHGDQSQANFDVDSSVVLVPPDPGPNPETTLWHYADNVDFDTTPSGYTQNMTVTTPYGVFSSFQGWHLAGVFANGIRSGEFILDAIDFSSQRGQGYIAVIGAGGGNIEAGTGHGWIDIEPLAMNTVIAGYDGYWSWPLAPEPSTFALLGLGLLGLYMKRAANRV
jgi:hypothetical protein